MTGTEPSAVARDVRTLFSAGAIGGLSDRQLLERFAGGGGDSAHAAFAALVDRHGALVWGVCRRILHDPHEAADAFQATFLVLVRRAPSIRLEDSLAPWLYGVSRKVAARARKTALRRPAPRDPQTLGALSSDPDPALIELLAVVDQEIARLPERHRAAVVLCDLGGLSHEEAARRLDCAVGTVGSRLSRGRETLRARLTRRGLAPSAGILAATLAAEAAPPARLVEATALAVVIDTSGHATIAGTVPATVVGLAEGVASAMLVSHAKWAAVALVTLGLATGGTLVHALPDNPANGDDPAAGAVADGPRAQPSPPPAARDGGFARTLRDQIDLLQIDLARWEAEHAKAHAQLELSLAMVATSKRLNERRQGMVSEEEMRKNEAECKVAQAQVQLAQVEIDGVKLRIQQLKSLADRPGDRAAYLARGRSLRTALAQQVSTREVELELLRKQAELVRATARIDAARDDVDVKVRMSKRRPGFVSDVEMKKTETAVKLAESEAAIVRAEIEGIKHRLRRVKETEGRTDAGERNAQTGSPAALEKRLNDLERKLDMVLDQLKRNPPDRPSR